MNPYLARLKAEISQTPLPQQPSKPSKAPFEPFEGERDIHVLQIHHAPNVDSGIPEIYRKAFDRLKADCPHGVDIGRWQQALYDAECFLDAWASQADKLGWLPDDLFGLHPTAPEARYDHMGLVWLLQGRLVVALTREHAVIRTKSGGELRYFRKGLKGEYS